MPRGGGYSERTRQEPRELDEDDAVVGVPDPLIVGPPARVWERSERDNDLEREGQAVVS